MASFSSHPFLPLHWIIRHVLVLVLVSSLLFLSSFTRFLSYHVNQITSRRNMETRKLGHRSVEKKRAPLFFLSPRHTQPLRPRFPSLCQSPLPPASCAKQLLFLRGVCHLKSLSLRKVCLNASLFFASNFGHLHNSLKVQHFTCILLGVILESKLTNFKNEKRICSDNL